MGCKVWDLAVLYGNSTKFPYNQCVTSSPLDWHACLPDECNNNVTPPTLLLSWAEPFTLMKRTLLIIGQVTAGGAPPRHDNPITWEDPGRRYRRNGVGISLAWSETHFLMNNKAFILLAVTRKVFVREGERWELKVQRILYTHSVTGLFGERKGGRAREKDSLQLETNRFVHLTV